MAYFMRYKGDDLITAFSKLKMKRPLIFDQHSAQMRNMLAYAESLKPSHSR
jgi:hypothetical protein